MRIFIALAFMCFMQIAGAQTTGEITDCKDCTTKVDTSIDNSLTVKTIEGTYAIVKVIENSTGNCIRKIFVSKDETFVAKNFPKGSYTVKFALGLDWDFNKKSKCKLKFKDEKPVFMKVDKPMQFRKVRKGDTYEISEFTMNLGITTSMTSKANRKIESGDFED